MQEDNTNIGLWLLVGIVAFILLIFIFLEIVSFISDFSLELQYLNMEIGRTDGDERNHWIHRRRRLWLSLIPFVKY